MPQVETSPGDQPPPTPGSCEPSHMDAGVDEKQPLQAVVDGLIRKDTTRLEARHVRTKGDIIKGKYTYIYACKMYIYI